MSTWLSVVGIGEDGLDGLGAQARRTVADAEILVGGARHLAMIPDDGRERMIWPSPFDALATELEARRGKRVCVLASGDPLWYGVGNTLARHFGPSDLSVHPAPSSFSLACARLGWPLHEVRAISLHGRPLERIAPWIQPGSRLIALSRDATTPAALARMLVGCGFGASRLVVLEHLGGERERLVEATAETLEANDFASLNVVALHCRSAADAAWLARTPGLPDEAFEHDGQITKRAVRAATLAALKPMTGGCLWDVGAGCGSVAIEWVRAASGASAVAIERRDDRVARIEHNARALGAHAVEAVLGAAPEALTGLPHPDAVFIGGGLSHATFEPCWAALGPGGRLVANAVTLEGERDLYDIEDRFGGTLTRIAVSHGRRVGRFRTFDPSRTVTQIELVKS